MQALFLLAQESGRDGINRWLDENPLVLGGLALLLGAVIGLWGVYELFQGVAHDKYGNAMHGGLGKTMSIVRVVAGIGVCGFGLYKIAFG